MTTSSHTVLCGACKCALEGPAQPKGQDMFSCPRCGRHDKFDNIMRIVKEYIADRMAEHVEAKMAKTMRQSNLFKVTVKPRPKRSHRFIVDMRL